MTKLIAIIDDEPEMEYLYDILMEEWKKKNLVSMIFFPDARDFLSWIPNHRPDLILSDIEMPFVSGLEIQQRILSTGRSIPTYFISGHEEADYLPQIKKLGISRFLSKPLDFNHIMKCIELDLGLALA